MMERSSRVKRQVANLERKLRNVQIALGHINRASHKSESFGAEVYTSNGARSAIWDAFTATRNEAKAIEARLSEITQAEQRGPRVDQHLDLGSTKTNLHGMWTVLTYSTVYGYWSPAHRGKTPNIAGPGAMFFGTEEEAREAAEGMSALV
jgi:hypothetical protein|tara:strand:- start:344 stop:793 length:450 start_codon:yes stop_codon:yes gene_type:complete